MEQTTLQKPLVILVLEDNEELREFCQMELETMDYGVVALEDAEQAVEMIRKTLREGREPPFGAVLTDINMRAVNGFDFCRYLKEREQTRDLPVIVMTGKGKEEYERYCSQAKEAGALAIFRKGPGLMQKIDQALREYF